MRLAFLAATFPSLTETFVLREWVSLRREEDMDVQTFAIRRPRGYSRGEFPDLLDELVHYLRPNFLLGIVLTSLWFPLLRFRRARRIARILRTELLRHPIQKAPSLIFQVLSGIYLGVYLKKHRFDIIHGHFSSASSIALFAHLASDIPFSYTIYANDDLFMTPVDFFVPKIECCKNVVTDTEYNRSMINLLTNYQYEDKVRVIYTGLDLEQFEDVKTKAEYGTPFRLLSVGSMSGFKGYPTVLEALRLVKEAGIEFEYHIAGGGDADVVEQLVNRYGLKDSVSILGARSFEAVRNEFEWCDVCVMASEIQSGGRRDGFPTVIAEAMLMRRLVIATYISDIPNNVINHETGLICAEKSPDQLASAIKFAAQSPGECRKMIENAHNMAVEKFDAKINYKLLADILRSGLKFELSDAG